MKPFLLLCLLLVLPLPAACATLRPWREVTSSVVRLSDLFDGIAPAADRELGEAPAPGARIIIGAPQLAAIARDFAVDWRPQSGAERAVLQRGGMRLRMEPVLAALRRALEANGMPADCEISLPGFEAPVLPAGHAPPLTVDQLVYDPNGATFTGVLGIAQDGAPGLQIRLSGRAISVSDAVVLTRHVRPGTILLAGDLRVARVRSTLLHGAASLHLADAAGFVLRRDIPAGQPLTEADVSKPILVTRAANVRISLTSQGIALGADGIALEEGGLGDRIRVQNPSSRAVILAEITGANTARVTASVAPVVVAQQ